MTKRTRTILFLTITSMFLVAAPSVILYTQGYRADTRDKKIVQTGGISIAAFPKSAEIYLNGKLKKSISFMSEKTFIQNLLPGIHTVTLKKDGYWDWQKELVVREKQVTEAHNIVLIPKDPAWSSLAEGINNYWPSPSGNVVVVERKDETELSLWLLNISNGDYEKLQFKSKYLAGADRMKNVVWSKDENKFILATETEGLYIVGDLNSKTASSYDLRRANARDLSFHPGDSNKVFFLSAKEQDANKYDLWVADLNQKGESYPVLQDIAGFGLVEKGIVWFGDLGYFYLGDFLGTITGVLNAERIHPKPDAQYRIISINPQKILLQENSNLFFLNPIAQSLEKMGDAKDVSLSPDQTRGAYFTDHEVWILYLEAQTGQPRKQLGDTTLLTRLSEEIHGITWLGPNHIVITVGGKIKIAEIDDRDGVNIAGVSTPSAPEEVSFSSATKKLYLLSGKTLFVSEKKFAQ